MKSYTLETPSTSPDREQALAVLSHAGEEIRFFKSQQWHVTNYALLAYVALASVPSWITASEAFASAICAVLVIATAGMALWVLRSLDVALEKERDRMGAARCKLPLVEAIHAKFGPVNSKVTSVLQAAILLGAIVAILINLSRLPWVDSG